MKRKTILLFLTFILIEISLVKSQVFVGGQFSSSFSSNDSRNLTSFDISPHAGYFLKDNRAIGGRIILDLVKYEQKNSDNDSKYREFGFEGFFRQYVDISDNVRFFVHAYSDLIFIKTKILTSEDKSANLLFGAKPAVSFKLAEHLDLEIMFGNLSFGILFDEDNTFDFNFVINEIGLGLSYKF